MQAEYLTAKQAANYTGVSESYLAKLRMDDSPVGGPKFLRIGVRMIRYRRSDLDAWMSQRVSERGRTPCQ